MAQFARPDSDVDSVWTPSTGTTRFGTIDEATASDTDYDTGTTGATSSQTCGLSNVTDPSSSTGHTVRYRYSKNANAGHQVNFTVELMQGASTVIASQTHVNIPDLNVGVQAGSFTLTGTEADNITDYTDLRFRFTSTKVGGGAAKAARVYWAELEVPDAGAAAINGSGTATLTPITASGDGDVDIEGAGTATLAPITESGAGDVGVEGGGTADLMPITASGAGTVGTPAANGSGTATLTPIAASGAGDVVVEGSGTASLTALAASGAGDVDVEGTGTADLSPITASGAGDVAVGGDGAAAITAVAADGTGTVIVEGAGALTLAPITLSGSGTIGSISNGSGQADLPPVAASGAGGVDVAGDGVADLTSIAASGAGGVEIVGVGQADLAAIGASGTGNAIGGIDAAGVLTLPVIVIQGGRGHVFNTGGGVDGFEVAGGSMGYGTNRKKKKFATGQGRVTR